MTAEIAVLNRLGVALAADSAVTISGPTTKIFNSADKLFELSDLVPVAVMINDNMDCFGTPWELIIKDFRREKGRNEHGTLKSWVEDFLGYVQCRSDLKGAPDQYLESLVSEELQIIDAYTYQLFRERGRKLHGQEDFLEIMREAIEKRSREIAVIPTIDELSSVDIDKYINSKIGRVQEAIQSYRLPVDLPEDLFSALVRNISSAMTKNIRSNLSSGLIFAGYGKSEDYPSVYAVDVIGFVIDKLKCAPPKQVSVQPNLDMGHVVSFAQTDVSDRLLEGVDTKFVNKICDYLYSAVDVLPELIVDSLGRARGSRRKAAVQEVSRILITLADKFKSSTAQSLRAEFRREFEQMIALMPKVELIEFAEALISITAIERKATPDQGTVGGPIDVAFISKHEGFVWIKRKHYFDPSLNPRYFWRKYSPQSVATGSTTE